MFLNLRWGTLRRYPRQEGGEGGKREGGGTATDRGRDKEGGGGNSGGIAHTREGTSRKKVQERKSDTETEATGGEAGTSQ